MIRTAAAAGAAEHPTLPAHFGRFAWALLLLAMAGAVDAVGFMRFHGLFVSFMSGNTTQAAVALADGRMSTSLPLLMVIGSFVAGVAAGDVIAGEPPHRGGAVLLVEAALLGGAALLDDAVAAPMLALAMGMHNALVLRAAKIGIALTFVTGTLVHFGRGIAARIARRKTVPPVWPYLAMWFALVVGSVAGGIGAQSAATVTLLALAGAASLTGIAFVTFTYLEATR